MTPLRRRTESVALAGVLAVAGACVGVGIVWTQLGRGIDRMFAPPL